MIKPVEKLDKISLAIPHFNRFLLLRECIQEILNDPRIDEICISDDCSTDGSYTKLVAWAKENPKVSLYHNSRNLDCYFNKHQAVLNARNKWVILFDDDNVIGPDYLDSLFNLPQEWSLNTVYCPEFAKPHFDYRAFSGVTVTRHNVAKLMQQPHFATMLNTANYFFYRETWLDVWDRSVNPHTSDSIYQAYRLLSSGVKLYITPGLQYFHRVHEGSHYKNNVHKTGAFAGKVEEMIRKLK